MGGKRKQAQRTKNNARPSSSGRSADLLSSAQALPRFAEINRNVGLTLSGLSAMMKPDELDPSVDSTFHIVFKKMNKKDSTTKLKALQEFSDLIGNSETEAIKVVMPMWCRLYGLLSADGDHRVREAVQVALHKIVSKDKKIVAPYLKQLIGPWFTSQYEPYAPAASAAARVFEATFSPEKMQNCILVCHKEILTFIGDNLGNRHPTHGANQLQPEDLEAKLERNIICSLQGYCMYLDILTAEQIKEHAEFNAAIVGDGKFMKLGSHKTSLIRAGFFKVISRLCQKAPFLLENSLSKIFPGVLAKLDESDPVAVQFVWESALVLIAGTEEWWKYVHIEKLFLPKLWKILKEGGHGNATIIYPNLITILSKLPPTIDLSVCYDRFFQNLVIGLNLNTVLLSKSESTAISTSLFECLKYVIVVNGTNVNLCEKLIKNHLVALIENILLENRSYHDSAFTFTSDLLHYWHKNKAQGNNYGHYLNYFWEILNCLFDTILTNICEGFEIKFLLDKQLDFLKYLGNMKQYRKTAGRVKFSVPHENSTDVCRQTVASQGDFKPDVPYSEDLKQTVFTIIKSYVMSMGNMKEKRDCFFSALLSLVKLFESEQFLRDLCKFFGKSFANDEETNLVDLYKNYLHKWMVTTDIVSKPLVHLVFLLFKYLDSADKEFVLQSLTELDPNYLGCCLIYGFSESYKQDSTVEKWLRSEKIEAYLLKTTDFNLSGMPDEQFKQILEQLFTTNGNGDLLLSEKTVKSIIRIFHRFISGENSEDFAHNLDLLSSILNNNKTPISYRLELLLTLFDSIYDHHSDADIEPVNALFFETVETLSRSSAGQDFVDFIQQVAFKLENIFLVVEPNRFDADYLASFKLDLIKSLAQEETFEVAHLFDMFFQRNSVSHWSQGNYEHCALAEYVSGNFYTQNHEIMDREEFTEDHISRHFLWTYMKIKVLTSPLDEQHPRVIDAIEKNSSIIVKLLYDLGTADIFLRNYRTSKCYQYARLVFNTLKSSLKQMVGDPEPIKQLLLELLPTDSVNFCIYINVISVFLTEFYESSSSSWIEIYEECCHRLPAENHIVNRLCLLQKFGRYLDFDRVPNTNSAGDSAVILRSLLHNEDIDVQIAEAFAKIKNASNMGDLAAIQEDGDLPCSQGVKDMVQIVRLYSDLIEKNRENIKHQVWDDLVLSLHIWSATLLRVRNSFESTLAFAAALASLFSNLNKHLIQLRKENPSHVWLEEWDALFGYEITSYFLQLWFYLSEQFESKGKDMPISYQPFLEHFSKVIDYLSSSLSLQNNGSNPSWKRIMKRSSSLLLHPSVILQLWGYKMLKVLTPVIIEADTEFIGDNDMTSSPQENKGPGFEHLKDSLLRTDQIMNELLVNFKLGEGSCQITPFTDSFTYAFAYLLQWRLLLDMCERASSELSYQYLDWLKTNGLFKRLLNNLFKLMPAEVLQHDEGKSQFYVKMFQEDPDLNSAEICTSEYLEHEVCRVYTLCLKQLPAVVRQWWSETDTKASHVIEDVTKYYVSPLLYQQELKDVANHKVEFKNMTIKVLHTVREVVAIYSVDETQLELVLSLPLNYPLGSPDVQCSRQIGGTSSKQWLMQMRKCLLHQNGRILDGLSSWNNNLDKKFDGIEECYICFAVLHHGTHQLPKLSCQTCKKKFHSACLYKWFSTSNKSTCPICRNLF